MLSRTTTIVLVAVVALGGGLYLYLKARDAAQTDSIPSDAYPPGRWQRVAPSAPSGGDLDRVLSLPYLQGKIEASDASGVVQHDPEATVDGFNLYCSGHAPEAILMDMRGTVRHRWRLSFEQAFPDRQPDVGGLYFRRVALLPDGHLIALFQGWGLVRIDRRSRLVWSLPLAAFNDFYVTADGRILLLNKKARIVPDINPEEPVLEDFIVEVSSEEKELRRWSLLELFRDSRYADLLGSTARSGDILHSNTITMLERSTIADGLFQPGRLLVSLREVNTIGVVDLEAETVTWAARGGWRRQHEPGLLPSGRILLFDNRGGPDGNARAIEIEPATGEIAWSWGGQPDQILFSPEGGSVARLPDGNTFIMASESGRAVEVTPGGIIVWEFFSPHRAGPRKELVATLWEVIRIDPETVPWIDKSSG